MMYKLVCGGIAGPIGQTLSYPWDVVRRRQQTWGFAPGTTELRETRTWYVLREIIRSEGVRGLFRGISINYLKASPTIGITFMAYETIREFLVRPQLV